MALPAYRRQSPFDVRLGCEARSHRYAGFTRRVRAVVQQAVMNSIKVKELT